MNGKHIIKQAAKQGAGIKQGKGSHVKIYTPRGMVTCPNRELGNGLAFTIIKQLFKIGIIITVLLVGIAVLSNMVGII
jgi:predicted RNA binding protein YcfA (HicA-like mRNA interferase family)